MNRFSLSLSLAFLCSSPLRAELDRSVPVPLDPARSIQAPPLEKGVLASGIRYALLEIKRLPLVSLNISFPFASSALDPEGKTGLGGFVAALLSEGTEKHPGGEFAEKIEETGAQMSVGSGNDGMGISITAERSQLGKALSLISEMIQHPTFPQEDLERVRGETLLALQEQKANPKTAGSKRFSERVFESHPYGREVTEASVNAIQREDLVAFHKERFHPSAALVAASGDINKDELEALMQEHFGSWKPGTLKELPLVPPMPNAAEKVAHGADLFIDLIDQPVPPSMKKMSQSSIMIGHPSIARNHPDFYAVYVMNQVLGGHTILNRLGKNLREEKHWAYGAKSAVSNMKRGGTISATTSVQTDKTAAAVAEILKEILRLQNEPVPAAELEATQRFLLGGFRVGLQSVSAMAAMASTVELMELPADTIQNFEKNIMGVSAADVQRVARTYLNPKTIAVVVVGDASRVKTELEEIAPVKLYDSQGRPIPQTAAGAS